MDKKCLIAGLPSAGKSTYIAAMWATEKEGDTGHELTCVKYPTDTTYLDGLRKKWQNMEIVDRTTLSSPAEIELTMHAIGKEGELTLLIPDFKGEIFQQVLTNNISDDIEKWCSQSDSILFFMRDLKPMTLQDEIPSLEGDKGVEQKQDIEMELKDIPLVIQNIMLLKYLNRKMNRCPIAVCISAWDSVEAAEADDNVEDWVRKNHPFLYQYITTHFDKPTFWGVSAQGLDYEHTTLSEEELTQRTIEGKRAYVCQKNVADNDITKPLAELLKTE